MTENQNPLFSNVDMLLSQYQTYAKSRKQFLEQIEHSTSCRDPLSEFSEIIVGKLLNAKLADSPVQKGYDLIKPDGEFVQVKYLSNPAGQWINGHEVKFLDTVDEYALVIYVSLELKAVIIFKRKTLRQVCERLRKKHPNQEHTLQFTKRNYETILSEETEFEKLGVKGYRFGEI